MGSPDLGSLPLVTTGSGLALDGAGVARHSFPVPPFAAGNEPCPLLLTAAAYGFAPF